MIRFSIKASVLVILCLIILSACKKDFLSFDFTDGNLSEDQVFSSDRHARGFLNNVYFGLLNRYNLSDGAMLSSASDESVNSTTNNTINIFTNGNWSPLVTFDDQHANMYNYLRRANIFLENCNTSGIKPQNDIPSLKGEAFFLRALFHFELFKRYGGIILATKSYAADETLDLPKNTPDEVVKQIVTDCDSAILMIATRSISEQIDPEKGRATKSAAMALKSRVLLYAASPLHNPSGDLTKWQLAADAAKTLININRYSLVPATTATPPLLPIWNYTSNPFNAEVIFATSADNINTIESNNAPIGYDNARGRANPTQELVDAFEMKNGKEISDVTSGYDRDNPYSTTGTSARDPRLNLFIMYNGSTFKSRLVETFVEGKDNLSINPNSTKTGYYMRKFLSDAAAWPTTGNTVTQRRPWVLFRYAEILLNAAEALNEASATPPAEAYTFINQVRARVGVAMPPLSGLTKEQFRLRVQKERRVELCFEDHRFFDVRRWRKGNEFFNKPVNGMRIEKIGTTLKYTPFQVAVRTYSDKMDLFPFPQGEINKVKNLVQNKGW